MFEMPVSMGSEGEEAPAMPLLPLPEMEQAKATTRPPVDLALIERQLREIVEYLKERVWKKPEREVR